MSISNTIRRAGPFICNGVTTAFPFQFKIFKSSEVIVSLTDGSGNLTTLSLGTDYTVALNSNQDSNPGGTVTALQAYASGYTITLTSGVAQTQPMVLTNTGGFYPNVINDSADRQTILIQQIQEVQGRSLTFPVSESGAATLPPLAQRAGYNAIWDADGNLTYGPMPTSIVIGREFWAEDYGVSALIGVLPVANVVALRVTLLALSAAGGGVLRFGAGTFYFDTATLALTGIVIPSNVTIRGTRGATVLAVTSQVPGYQVGTSTAPGVLFTAASGAVNVGIEDCELRGLLNFNKVTGPSLKRVIVTGPMTTKAQYGETGLSFVAAMADGVRRYSTTETDTATDIGTTATPFTDATITLSGNVLSITPTMTTHLGYYRYAVSDYIAVDPTKFYVVRYLNGFYSGRGGARQKILLYDANKNPVVSNQATNPTNYFESNLSDKTDYTSAAIRGASYLRIEVGAYKGGDGIPGLTAQFDLSAVQILEVLADSKGWLQHMLAQAQAGAAPGTVDSPANFGQLTLLNCYNAVVEDCDFRMIDRAAISMTSCTFSSITASRFDYVMQGCVDSYGRFNKIDGNLLDGRFLTTAGLSAADEYAARIGARAFRIRAVGGSNCDQLTVSNNKWQGFSWGAEIICYSISRVCYLYNNVGRNEFCGYSLFDGTFDVDGGSLDGAGDAIHLLECPGQDTNPDTQIATIRNMTIRFGDFCPNGGVGISSTAGLSVTVSNCFIRAPLGIQLLGSANSTMKISNTRIEYGWCGILGRGGPMQIECPSIVPWVKTPNCVGSGAGAQSGPINIVPVDPAARVDIDVGTLEVANNSASYLAGIQSLRLRLRDVVTPLDNFPLQYIGLVPPAGAVSWDLDRINFRGLPATVTSSSWAGIPSNPATGSRVTMSGCKVSQLPAQPPAGTYTRAYLAGDPWIISFALGGTTLGTIAAGGVWQQTITVPGAAVGFTNPDVISSTPGGLSGLTKQCWVTADDTVLVRFMNNTGAALTFSYVQTLIVFGNIIR